MKLLYCEHCEDIFKPGFDSVRTCECGRVKGQYINDGEAEVSPEAVSIAISNVSLLQAIEDMRRHQAETNDQAGWHEYFQWCNGLLSYAWVRPNTSPGNPRTRLIEAQERKVLDKRYLRMPLPAKQKLMLELKKVR